jgi:hypothetical protein
VAARGGRGDRARRRSLALATSRPVESQWYHFEEMHDAKKRTGVTLDFVAGADDAVMIFRLKPFDSRWDALRIEHDGAPAEAALSTFDSAIYTAAPRSAGPVRWRISFQTDAPQWVDVDLI